MMLYTKYVWTALGCEMGKLGNVMETRKAGFPASIAYKPLEANMTIARAWLEAGYIAESDIKLPQLHFHWIKGDTSAKYHMIKVFNENNIEWVNGSYGQLMAKIGKNNEMVDVEYYHVDGNLYGIIEKPMSTSRYFEMAPEMLSKNDGVYTKEENLLRENNIHESPFCKNLYHAIRKAAEYIRLDCDDVRILQKIDNTYAVVSH